MLDLRATGEDVNRQDTVYVRVAAILIVRIEAGTKPPSQTKKGLEFEFFLKFQSFYFA